MPIEYPETENAVDKYAEQLAEIESLISSNSDCHVKSASRKMKVWGRGP